MHRVVGGKEDVRAVDRNVAGIVEVAAPPFAPRATQLARRDRYLTGVGADNRVERSRRRCRQIRRDVTNGSKSELPRQAVLAPVLSAPELTHGLVADDRQRTAREVRAVIDDAPVSSAGAETTVTETAW